MRNLEWWFEFSHRRLSHSQWLNVSEDHCRLWHRVKEGRVAEILGKQEVSRVNKWRGHISRMFLRLTDGQDIFIELNYIFSGRFKWKLCFDHSSLALQCDWSGDYAMNVTTVTTGRLYKICDSPVASFFFQICQQTFVVIWKLIAFLKKLPLSMSYYCRSWVSNPRPASLYCAATLVNYVFPIIITQKFKGLSIPRAARGPVHNNGCSSLP